MGEAPHLTTVVYVGILLRWKIAPELMGLSFNALPFPRDPSVPSHVMARAWSDVSGTTQIGSEDTPRYTSDIPAG